MAGDARHRTQDSLPGARDTGDAGEQMSPQDRAAYAAAWRQVHHTMIRCTAMGFVLNLVCLALLGILLCGPAEASVAVGLSMIGLAVPAGLVIGAASMELCCGAMRSAAYRLLQSHSTNALGAAVFALRQCGFRTRAALGQEVSARLDELRPEDARYFRARDLNQLYAVGAAGPRLGLRRFSTELRRAAVRASALVGGPGAVPVLRRLARRRADAVIATQAGACLSVLEERLHQEAFIASSLRVPAPPQGEGAELLRVRDAGRPGTRGIVGSESDVTDAAVRRPFEGRG